MLAEVGLDAENVHFPFVEVDLDVKAAAVNLQLNVRVQGTCRFNLERLHDKLKFVFITQSHERSTVCFSE